MNPASRNLSAITGDYERAASLSANTSSIIRESIIRYCQQTNDARIAGEIVLYIINTVIKLALERVHFMARRREKEEIDKESVRERGTRGDKEKEIEIRVSRHVFIRREAVTGFYVFIYLSFRAVYTMSGYISTEKYI